MRNLLLFNFILFVIPVSGQKWQGVPTPLEIGQGPVFAKFMNKDTIFVSYNCCGYMISKDGGISYDKTGNAFNYFEGRFQNVQNDLYISTLRNIEGKWRYYTIISKDLGKSWRDTVFMPYIEDTTAIKWVNSSFTYFYDKSNIVHISGYQSDSCRIAYRSIDGGNTWNLLACDAINFPSSYNYISYPNVNQFSGTTYFLFRSLISSDSSLIFVRMEDYGARVISARLDFLPKLKGKESIAFKDSLNGIIYMRGSTGNLARTSDGGRTWAINPSTVNIDGGMALYAKETVNSKGFYFIGSDPTRYSLDDGASFQSLPDSYIQEAADFFNAESGISLSAKLTTNDDNARVFLGIANSLYVPKGVGKLNLHPNPARDNLHIELPIEDLAGCTFLINDVMGKTWQGILEISQTQIDIASLLRDFFS